MKLLICGAFSTGKTTLISDVSSLVLSLGSARSIEDVARQCPMPLNKDQKFDSFIWLLGRQIQEESEACWRGTDLVICDRGVPDILSHYLWMFRGERDSVHRDFRAFALSWIGTYDLIFLTRVDSGVQVEPDGLRVLDREYRSELDQIIFELLNDARVPFIELPHGRLERAVVFEREVRQLVMSGV
ncbi:ATP-binding protein [Bradyrhizobium sp. HKCCYLRH2060]|uniref:ATP/GTP-binding protein n=1 Tax=Bradyrhizobium TaxID=374 RepID=UPI0029162C61|nr:ATP-binding protein [Bradyrhizobium sp. SZCCHNR3003]